MKRESNTLSTADLARAGAESAAEPLSDRPGVAISGSHGGVLEPEPAQGTPGREENARNRPERHPAGSGTAQSAAPAMALAKPESTAPAKPESTPAPAGQRDAGATDSGRTSDTTTGPLFEPKEAEHFHARWNEIQVGFVDEPRTAVERADNLVAETIKRLAESFAAGRQQLESEWGKGGNASTETLRLSLQRYRSFFNRLLSI